MTQYVTLREARALVKGAVQCNSAECSTILLGDLPDTWDLTDTTQLTSALQLLMPGTWDAAHVTKLAKAIPTEARGSTNCVAMCSHYRS